MSAIFFGVGIAIVLITANFFALPADTNRSVLNLLAGCGLVAAAVQIYFPWNRVHRNLLVANTLGTTLLVAFLVANSGGAHSPFTSYYFMIAVFAALYYGRGLAIVVGLVVAGLSLLPLLGTAEPVAVTQLLLTAPIYFSIAITGQFMATELTRQRHEHAVLTNELIRASESHALALESARTDALTSLRNRAALGEELQSLVVQYQSTQRPFSLLFLDIDHFKQLNDRHGHACGDDVLRQVALLIKNHSRSSDIAARYGGEEFVILLPGASEDTALRLGERLRSAVEQHRFWTPQTANRLAITISIGVAACPRDGINADDLLNHADASMYAAKRGGRNQVRWLRGISSVAKSRESA